jgi:hypothetical protein
METITRLIALKFGKPIAPVGRWIAAMLRASVPETAVDENHDTLAAKRKIGTAGQRLVTAPTGDSISPKYGGKLELCLLVPAGTDTGHHVRTLFFGENVWHRPRQFYQDVKGKAPKAFMKNALYLCRLTCMWLGRIFS